jgi:hypothetical protein
MRIIFLAVTFALALRGCSENQETMETVVVPSINGTWKLISSKIISQNDTSITFPVPDQEMIKIFTDDTFAFFKHNTNGSTGDSAVFDAGSGTYTLDGDRYAEHLEYCSYRGWENKDFQFTLRLRNDTLIQTGFETIDSLNINQEITEIYVRRP